jgi:hypothetical protein
MNIISLGGKTIKNIIQWDLKTKTFSNSDIENLHALKYHSKSILAHTSLRKLKLLYQSSKIDKKKEKKCLDSLFIYLSKEWSPTFQSCATII